MDCPVELTPCSMMGTAWFLCELFKVGSNSLESNVPEAPVSIRKKRSVLAMRSIMHGKAEREGDLSLFRIILNAGMAPLS